MKDTDSQRKTDAAWIELARKACAYAGVEYGKIEALLGFMGQTEEVGMSDGFEVDLLQCGISPVQQFHSQREDLAVMILNDNGTLFEGEQNPEH